MERTNDVTDEEIFAMWQRQNARCGFNLIAFARAVEGLVQYELLRKEEEQKQEIPQNTSL
jgi:hypothetical protein